MASADGKKITKLDGFEADLGWRFTNRSLLLRALTHPSAASNAGQNYQRLEFLGDRVLGLVIAHTLFSKFPDDDEGSLAVRYNELVSRQSCAKCAKHLRLGSLVKLSSGESRAGGAQKMALLANAMEAVLGAVYLDGGFAAAQKVVLKHWQELLASSETFKQDPKTELQEFSQAKFKQLPHYRLIKTSGADHAPQFEIAVSLPDGRQAEASAGSKRGAERAAAERLLRMVSGD